MAGSVNKVIILGSLGKDPEVRNFQNGGKVVNLRVATSERYKDREGNQQERTEWHSVAIFNEKLGEIAERYLKKGSQVYLEGQLETRKWTTNEGQERYSTEIVLRQFRGEMTLVGGRNQGGGGGDEAGGGFGGDRGERSGGGFGGGASGGGYGGGRGGASSGGAAKPARGGGGGGGGWDAPKADLDDDIPF
ncbi:single-stranded DNA-binding protein [Roseomonas nepalensis]|uniref:Single-stranded DNA-binding protein n=1 Tax=Muricoccus nepalensis TaxID=1854500 RepID=A0A502G1K2_9PROT|nr:single-stranded DNA-binding protein [Roseomonas nepalensis]TPG55491.1 single-stranded DNA-binding protein [Roseomonas nepalensis]